MAPKAKPLKNSNVVNDKLGSTAYILKSITVPKCCKTCVSFMPIYNSSLGEFTIDCKKQIFFPIVKQSCMGKR